MAPSWRRIADITLTSGSLLISNQVLQAGSSISLTVTNYLDDGSLSNSVDVVTNRNTWTVGGGINLFRLPTNSSLLATTITNTRLPDAEVDQLLGREGLRLLAERAL